MLLITLATFVVGLALLAWGGDRFVLGSGAIAKNLRLPPIVIGLTVAGFATSAPEMLISAVASLGGNPSLALGNAVGSNIANIGLVLGVAALIQPLTLRSATTRQQLLALFLITILAFPLFFDGFLSHDGFAGNDNIFSFTFTGLFHPVSHGLFDIAYSGHHGFQFIRFKAGSMIGAK